MTAVTLAPVPTAPSTVPSMEDPAGLEELRRSVRSLAEGLAELPGGDPRWQTVGGSVTAVADLVRRSVGSSGATGSVDLTPVVRLRDLAVAARFLLGRGVTIVDPEAARDVLTRCEGIEITLARWSLQAARAPGYSGVVDGV